MTALISSDGRFRYELRRSVGLGQGVVCWIMFNPSTADSERNDPTIRRCLDFSRRWGFAEMVVVNLLPLRSPDPKEASRYFREPPVPGEYFVNEGHIEKAALDADLVVAAWGSLASDWGWSARDNLPVELWALGFNKDDQPKHPLYVRANATPISLMDGRAWQRSETVRTP